LFLETVSGWKPQGSEAFYRLHHPEETMCSKYAGIAGFSFEI
jgi:hypothetical protein